MATTDRNSMLYWWPRVKDLGIPVPRTIIVEQPREGFLRELSCGICEGEPMPDGHQDYFDRVRAATDEMRYPCFLRTDQLSGKHEWIETCYLPGAGELGHHMSRILEYSLIAEFPGTIENRAMVVRELLPLHSTFTSFRGLPIARERRYFVRDGVVECHHAYWPEAAVEKGHPSSPQWRDLLKQTNRDPAEEEQIMFQNYAARIGRALPGYLSVDFAMTTGGVWYLIDMADGSDSWHPDCAIRGD